MGNQPPQRVRATIDPETNKVTITHDLLSALDGKQAKPAAVTEAERRRFAAAFEELKERHDKLNALIDSAHEAGYHLGAESAAAAAPPDYTPLVQNLNDNLEQLSSKAEGKLDADSAALSAQLESSAKFTTAAVCEIEEANVVQCLQSDPSQTLNCHALVAAYSECAARARRSVFDSLS
mmetsp:Transcript_33772/g.88743  ORF Transcript_33772/g.88743 Transcript_33772/m.88743 type:complete len:179 (-) Transcript_33772:359-895(-)